jgi:DNA-binding transcriptional ArsR family regulator
MNEDIVDLRAALAALSGRVAALEGAGRPRPEDAHEQPAFWALRGLREQLAADPDVTDGAVMLVGSVVLPDGAAEWQQAASTAGLVESEWSELSTVLSALAHPVRLEILRRIVTGTHSTAELASLAGLGTTGQLHHHLRQLVGAGWVRQSGRGSYEVPAARVVPLLAVIAAAQR